MRIAILSDSHDNITNLNKAISWCKENNIEHLIHCGDVATIATAQHICQSFGKNVSISLGNADYGRNWEVVPASIFKEFGELKKEKIAFTHYLSVAQKIAQSKKYNIVFYGHTHLPWIGRFANTELVNPGNMAGIYCRPTFVFWDSKTGKLELKEILKLS